MREAKDQNALKITHQLRAPRGGGCMTYGLKCEGVILTLVVSPRASETDPGEWRIEARVKRGPLEDITAAEWGSTRKDALQAVGRAWDSQRINHGLRMFDWEAVSRVLNEVRAL
jgi:hypothetical protein